MDENRLGSHTVLIRDKKRIEISGVDAVESFDREMIVLRLAEGKLLIEGESLEIGELSVGNRIVTADGEIQSIQYLAGTGKGRSGIFRRK